MKAIFLGMVLLSVSLHAGEFLDVTTGSFVDARDSSQYHWVKIKDQSWMADNLHFVMPEGSFCYDDDAEHCKVYGRLYTWDVAMKACPTGWHLPKRKEWDILINLLGGENQAGYAMKSFHTEFNGWNSKNNDGNSSQFSAVPTGFRTQGGVFEDFPSYAYFWEGEAIDAKDAGYRALSSSWKNMQALGASKLDAVGVRCIKD